MHLKTLLAGLSLRSATADMETEITRISYDSRTTAPGDVFVAMTGFAADGHAYIGKAMAAGAAAVADEAYFAACTAAIRQTRAWTVGELENLGFTVLPSQANFVFARHGQLPGETLYRKLKENGVLVRWFDADRIRDYVRITIGSMEQMETLVEELTALLEEL